MSLNQTQIQTHDFLNPRAAAVLTAIGEAHGWNSFTWYEENDGTVRFRLPRVPQDGFIPANDSRITWY